MNPFRYGQVVGADEFCPRPGLVKQLTRFMASGQNAVVQGERRMGKTSLIHEAARKHKRRRMIYVDLLAIKTVNDLCKRLVTGIASAEHQAGFLERMLKALSQLRPVLSLDPTTGEPSVSLDAGIKMRPDSTDGLLELVAEMNRRKPVVVVLDEFQGVGNLAEREEVLATLRSKIQFQSSIPYVFAGSVRNEMRNIFSDPDSPFFKSAAALDVGPIDEPRFVQFLSRRFQKGTRRADDEVIREIIHRADDVPGDAQELCACLWEATSPREKITLDHVGGALELIYARESKGYEATLVHLTGPQLRCLVGLARFGGEAPHSADFVKAAGLRTPATVQRALNRLAKLRIVYRHDRTYRFSNPFFRRWLVWKEY